MKKNKIYLSKLNKESDKGSALVTVLVIVGFISILATIILYLAATNYKMKITDSRTKESFYEAEEVVELFRVNLVCDVAEASRRAYGQCGSEYVFMDSKETRRERYLLAFNNELRTIWEEKWEDSAPDAHDGLRRGLDDIFDGATVTMAADGYNSSTGISNFNLIISDPVAGTSKTYYCIFNEYSTNALAGGNFHYKDALVVPSDDNLYKADDSVNPSELHSFNITVTDGKDYTSKIVTSFLITPPEFNWDDEVFVGDDGTEITDIDYSECVVYNGWSKE